VKFGLKIPNRLGKTARKTSPHTGIFLLTLQCVVVVVVTVATAAAATLLKSKKTHF